MGGAEDIIVEMLGLKDAVKMRPAREKPGIGIFHQVFLYIVPHYFGDLFVISWAHAKPVVVESQFKGNEQFVAEHVVILELVNRVAQLEFSVLIPARRKAQRRATTEFFFFISLNKGFGAIVGDELEIQLEGHLV